MKWARIEMGGKSSSASTVTRYNTGAKRRRNQMDPNSDEALTNSVMTFGREMYQVLKANNDKQHWSEVRINHLLIHMIDNARSLQKMFRTGSNKDQVIKTCADVANYAMMISEKVQSDDTFTISPIADYKSKLLSFMEENAVLNGVRYEDIREWCYKKRWDSRVAMEICKAMIDTGEAYEPHPDWIRVI